MRPGEPGVIKTAGGGRSRAGGERGGVPGTSDFDDAVQAKRRERMKRAAHAGNRLFLAAQNAGWKNALRRHRESRIGAEGDGGNERVPARRGVYDLGRKARALAA